MTGDQYATYLRSPHWVAVRHQFAGRHPWCAVCGSTSRLDTHHMTYSRLGHEEPGDLVRLCHGHHRRIHSLLAHHGWRVTTEHSNAAMREMVDEYAHPRKAPAAGGIFGRIARALVRA